MKDLLRSITQQWCILWFGCFFLGGEEGVS